MVEIGFQERLRFVKLADDLVEKAAQTAEFSLELRAMKKNRSVPTDTVLPHVMYACIPDALTWLERVFGFVEHYRYGEPRGPVSGAQVYAGKACIQLSRARGFKIPSQLGHGTQYLTVFVEDVDTHYAHTKEEGARIVEALNETVYGERQYAVEDLEGHRWLFSQHAKDLSPEEWGATLAGKARH
jgi:uncharacterized glyoxalase superfamily protein PhnB